MVAEADNQIPPGGSQERVFEKTDCLRYFGCCRHFCREESRSHTSVRSLRRSAFHRLTAPSVGEQFHSYRRGLACSRWVGHP